MIALQHDVFEFFKDGTDSTLLLPVLVYLRRNVQALT